VTALQLRLPHVSSSHGPITPSSPPAARLSRAAEAAPLPPRPPLSHGIAAPLIRQPPLLTRGATGDNPSTGDTAAPPRPHRAARSALPLAPPPPSGFSPSLDSPRWHLRLRLELRLREEEGRHTARVRFTVANYII
jgi:hypothetical protein